jgi:hypothetical protein
MVVKIKRSLNNLRNRLVYKPEEWEDSIQLWIKKEQLISLHLPDSELHKQLSLKNYLKG